MSTAPFFAQQLARDSDVAGLAEKLPDDVNTLKGMVVELVLALQRRELDNETLRERLDRVLCRLYGPRGERVDDHQPLLFTDVVDGPETAATRAASATEEAAAEPRAQAALPTARP